MNLDRQISTQARIEEQYRRIQQELTGGAVALVGVFWLGTIWYHLIEGWRWVDAAYMTMITLATVGFLEVQPLGDRGRLFTMSLILLGVISIGYIVNRFTEALIQGYFQAGLRIQRQRRIMEALSGHYIICGFGRMGRQAALEFQSEGVRFVVTDSQSDPIHAAQELGFPALQGDATLDETLLKLGVERAVCIIAALPSDAENLYTVLSAKTLNPMIRAIARASNEEALQKLQRAGADAVISPYITGGKRMAAAALRPQVMDFVDGILTGTDRTFYMEEFQLDASTCPHVGESLREAKLRSQSGALVLAIRRSDGTLISGPNADTTLMQGDQLICMGTAEQLRRLNQILCPIRSDSPRPPRHGQ
ncbi:potassium channel protein [Kovacikia minuta CCNUW1]|uniref:potassium channel family protein n=1 Tax=Kovacikia minuta TaxID=2931930 RepID=UPI001CCC669D|nr:potassium channel protein [Kovacikia minuta]UBF23788.1 potassium channel protein [Kovacikia minuta CCNUW1]